MKTPGKFCADNWILPGGALEKAIAARDAEWQSRLAASETALRTAINCGSACGTVGHQCQECLRKMFHREVARREEVQDALRVAVEHARDVQVRLDEAQAFVRRVAKMGATVIQPTRLELDAIALVKWWDTGEPASVESSGVALPCGHAQHGTGAFCKDPTGLCPQAAFGPRRTIPKDADPTIQPPSVESPVVVSALPTPVRCDLATIQANAHGMGQEQALADVTDWLIEEGAEDLVRKLETGEWHAIRGRRQTDPNEEISAPRVESSGVAVKCAYSDAVGVCNCEPSAHTPEWTHAFQAEPNAWRPLVVAYAPEPVPAGNAGAGEAKTLGELLAGKPPGSWVVIDPGMTEVKAVADSPEQALLDAGYKNEPSANDDIDSLPVMVCIPGKAPAPERDPCAACQGRGGFTSHGNPEPEWRALGPDHACGRCDGTGVAK